jgi:hypothetical protein
MTTYNNFGVNVGALGRNSEPVAPSHARAGDPTLGGTTTTAIAAAIALAPATTALDAAMATLVADGATPTQAHVTAANSALTTFETALTAYKAAVAALAVSGSAIGLTSDVHILVGSTVTKRNAFRRAVEVAVRQIMYSSNLLSD